MATKRILWPVRSSAVLGAKDACELLPYFTDSSVPLRSFPLRTRPLRAMREPLEAEAIPNCLLDSL